MNIRLVRFVNALHIGKQLDLNSSLEVGQRVVDDRIIALERYDDTFMGVVFNSGYTQLIPFAQVSGAYLADDKERVSNKSRS